MTVRFVVTEHPGALTDELELHFERIRRRLEDVSRLEVLADVYPRVDSLDGASAVVLSGSFAPWAAHDRAALARLGDVVRAYEGPVLGICAGMQLQALFAGGAVGAAARETPTGFHPVDVLDDTDLLRGLPPRATVYHHHGDEITRLPAGFLVLASSPSCDVEAIAAPERRWWGTQFHPEEFSADHREGEQVLRNFFALARS